MANTVRSRKQKGTRFQKEIVKKILEYFNILTENDVRSVPSGISGPDIWFSERASEILPYDIECKNQEKTSIFKWLQQLDNRRKDSLIPILIFKRNRSKPYVCIDVEDFFNIVRKNYDL